MSCHGWHSQSQGSIFNSKFTVKPQESHVEDSMTEGERNGFAGILGTCCFLGGAEASF